MLIYIAGPYRADTPEGIERNINQAREVAIALWQQGHTPICPHANSAHMDEGTGICARRFLDGDLQILARCDAIVLTPDWARSQGARAELAFAEARGIPEYVWPDVPELHPTEVNRPEQVAAFIDVVMAMYRVHLQKNADYSAANILGTGFVGLVTRLWDKMARLMNLTGFHIEIASSAFTAPKEPKNESLDDSLLDLGNYAVIGQLLRRGVWGK